MLESSVGETFLLQLEVDSETDGLVDAIVGFRLLHITEFADRQLNPAQHTSQVGLPQHNPGIDSQ